MNFIHTHTLRKAIALVLLSTSTAALAVPAPWYKWRSKLEDITICAQFSPGDGWEAVRGPFQDGNCKKPGALK